MTLSSLPLSYCTNVHPARTVSEVVAGLSEHAAAARQRLDFPVAAGLWLSAAVTKELISDPASLELLAQTLWQHDLLLWSLCHLSALQQPLVRNCSWVV